MGLPVGIDPGTRKSFNIRQQRSACYTFLFSGGGGSSSSSLVLAL
jgi:hypothetical protein